MDKLTNKELVSLAMSGNEKAVEELCRRFTLAMEMCAKPQMYYKREFDAIAEGPKKRKRGPDPEDDDDDDDDDATFRKRSTAISSRPVNPKRGRN